MEVQIEPAERGDRMSLREAVLGMQAASAMSARSVLGAASHLNFLQRIASGGFCHLRSRWNVVNDGCIMD